MGLAYSARADFARNGDFDVLRIRDMLSILKIDLQFSFSIFLRTNNFQFNFSKSSFGYEPSHAAPIGVICGTCSFSYFSCNEVFSRSKVPFPRVKPREIRCFGYWPLGVK